MARYGIVILRFLLYGTPHGHQRARARGWTPHGSAQKRGRKQFTTNRKRHVTGHKNRLRRVTLSPGGIIPLATGESQQMRGTLRLV